MVSGVLMSIRPAYADAILDGTKTVELRRRRPSFAEGTRVLIYSSTPHRHVRGSFEAGAVLAAAPDQLWLQVGDRAGVDRDTFDAYFNGCAVAYGIEVRNPRRLPPRRLRIRPPQSYLFLRRGVPGHSGLVRLACATQTPGA